MTGETVTPSTVVRRLLSHRSRPPEPSLTEKAPRTRAEKGGWHLPLEERARQMRENIADAKARGLL